jgi:hypothetical protein
VVQTNPSILLAKATGVAARAAGMAHGATHPEMRDALRAVEIIARESRFWLQERTDAASLLAIEEGLQTQAKRLDDLEDTLRRDSGAKP